MILHFETTAFKDHPKGKTGVVSRKDHKDAACFVAFSILGSKHPVQFLRDIPPRGRKVRHVHYFVCDSIFISIW